MSRKPVTLSAAGLFVCAAIPLAIVLLGGQSAAAASKPVTCPDNTAGVKITVSAPNGGPPRIVSVNKPVSTAQAAADSCILSYAS